jgi:hypothetical protein
MGKMLDEFLGDEVMMDAAQGPDEVSPPRAARGKFAYDYYRFDASETEVFADMAGDDQEQMAQVAFNAAEERSRLYVMPCEWTAWFVTPQGERYFLGRDYAQGDTITVRRQRRRSRTVRVYSVCENTPGYLPEGEPYWTRNRRQAERVAREIVKGYLEEWDDGGRPLYGVCGSARDGYEIIDLRLHHDLGRVVKVIELDVTHEEWAEYQQLNGG